MGTRTVTIDGVRGVQLFRVASGVTLGLTGLTLTRSTTGNGGAIYNDGGTVAITGSTLSGNSVTFGGGTGGAIYNSIDSTLTITESTLSGNLSGNSTAGYGGAIGNNGGTLLLTLAVVTGNTAGSADPDIFGNVTTDGGGNVVGSTNGSSGLTTASDKLNIDPLLGPLASNGGPVKTLALLPGSPAINILACPAALTTDARGVARPQGPLCDAGSYEARAFTLGTLTGNSQRQG